MREISTRPTRGRGANDGGGLGRRVRLVRTLAGSGVGATRDGVGVDASFDSPQGVLLDEVVP